MALFFTSDTHFGHANIINLSNRPFADVQEMNEALVANWNSVVGPDDFVYHLGDVALGPIRDSLEYIRRLNGYKMLIIGNHDRNFRLGKRSGGLEPEQWDDVYEEVGFRKVDQGGTISFGGMKFALSHFPYSGDSHADERHKEARRQDEGMPLIHGHTHSSGDPFSRSVNGTPQIHVGVDAWDFRPVSADAVMASYVANV